MYLVNKCCLRFGLSSSSVDIDNVKEMYQFKYIIEMMIVLYV